MPQLIRTPEQIFREEAKDIYVIRFKERHKDDDFFPSSQEDLPTRKMMLAWLAENLPNSRVEYLAPSEKSGFVSGYFGDLRVDFSESDLAIFCDRWEKSDGGSVDPRFQCYLWPYNQWLDESNKFMPTRDRPEVPGLSIWWDTPIGIIYHQINEKDAIDQNLDIHPGNQGDIWHNAIQLWPELALIQGPYGATHGYTVRHKTEPWSLLYTCGGSVFEPLEFPPERQQQLITWLRLPEDTKITKDEW